jgi:hypothetical protein
MERFATLPLPLLKRILAFADSADHDSIMPHPPRVPLTLLRRLESSHSIWKPVVAQLHRNLSIAATVVVKPPRKARSPYSSALQEIAAFAKRTVPLRSLELRVAAAVEGDDDDQELEAWCSAFAGVPHLERLELRCIDANSAVLCLIVKAAALMCPRMQALVVHPKFNGQRQEGCGVVQKLRATVYDALKQWHDRTPEGGLRQLDFPLRYTQQELEVPKLLGQLEPEFYQTLVQYCPHLEYLNVLESPSELVWSYLRCNSATFPVELWKAFTTSCLALRALDWITLPYTDRHFSIFAHTPKPNVETIRWRGTEGNHTTVSNGQCSYTTEGIVQVLRACPQVKDVCVEFDHRLSFQVWFHRQYIFNNDFLIALAKNCECVESFSLIEVNRSDETRAVVPLNEVDDRGVAALAALPNLRRVQMKVTRVTGRGVFDLIRHAPTRGQPRTIELDVGSPRRTSDFDDDEDEDVLFHDVVQQLLELISRQPQEVVGRKFYLKIENKSRNDPGTDEWTNELVHAAQVVDVELQEEFERISWVPRTPRIERVILRSKAAAGGTTTVLPRRPLHL